MQGQGAESSAVPMSRRHPEYYFEDGNLVMLVEDVLFCIHRYLLRKHSPVFEGMLTLPQSDQAPTVEGASDANPIVLPQVQSADFANLMWMFYDERFDTDPTSRRSASKWQSILSLSHRWDMTAIRTAALEALSNCQPPLDPVEKLSICSLYQIEKTWALDAFVALAKRNKKLTVPEGRKIGVDCMVILADAREELAVSRGVPGNMTWMSTSPHSQGGDVYERSVKLAIQRAEKGPGSGDAEPILPHPSFLNNGGSTSYGTGHIPWFPPDLTPNALGLVNQN